MRYASAVPMYVPGPWVGLARGVGDGAAVTVGAGVCVGLGDAGATTFVLVAPGAFAVVPHAVATRSATIAIRIATDDTRSACSRRLARQVVRYCLNHSIVATQAFRACSAL